MLLIGCVTNVTEYSSAKVMKQKISVTMTMTNALTRTSISSAVNRGLLLSRSLSSNSFNFLLQYRGYKVFGTVLVELTPGLLASCIREVVGVLAKIPKTVFAPGQTQGYRQRYQELCHGFSSQLLSSVSPPSRSVAWIRV